MKTKILSGFACEPLDDVSLVIHEGIMFAYGYCGYEQAKTFYFNKTAATQYHFIYGEIDRSVIPNTFELKVKNNQGGSEVKPTTFRQDVLSTVKTGVFQLPLYRITLGSDGIEEITDLRDKKDYIKKVFYADETKKKITKEIASGAFLPWTHDTSDYSEKVATTMFVHNAIKNYIDNGTTPTGWYEAVIIEKTRTQGVSNSWDFYFNATITPTKVRYNNVEYTVLGQDQNNRWYYRATSAQGADSMIVGTTIEYQ